MFLQQEQLIRTMHVLFLNIVDGDHALVNRAKDIENSSIHHDYALASDTVRDSHDLATRASGYINGS